MATKGQIRFSAVKKMMKNCAPGSTVGTKKHRTWVYWDDRIFRGLPKAGHKKADFEIEHGHVRQLVNFFGLDPECVSKYLPQLA